MTSSVGQPVSPRWHQLALAAAAVQCVTWGVFIIVWPSASALGYGFSSPPEQLFLWQGLGLVILLYGIGYALAATNPRQHWGLVLIGLLAKTLGPVGMVWAVSHGLAPTRVLHLLPINDVVWWIPFVMIIRFAVRSGSEHAPQQD